MLRGSRHGGLGGFCGVAALLHPGETLESCAILLMLKLAHTHDCSGGTNSYMLCPAERCYSTRKLSDEMPFPGAQCA